MKTHVIRDSEGNIRIIIDQYLGAYSVAVWSQDDELEASFNSKNNVVENEKRRLRNANKQDTVRKVEEVPFESERASSSRESLGEGSFPSVTEPAGFISKAK